MIRYVRHMKRSPGTRPTRFLLPFPRAVRWNVPDHKEIFDKGNQTSPVVRLRVNGAVRSRNKKSDRFLGPLT
jgi:hypothetical protein